ncbi:hypothetical protein GALMADRAFT_245361 [Galerina marginata CBS 339.88]|uniref:Uncharacterized protein n=1 Tax=Galerina marginata (strain CBS 339.88) TaxID=685588 RepID=A0A067T4Z8_GALM3|nr:hypothetical protein GALMADRAFT_245361 [Galerina marginata CBS 339.88]
MDLTFKPIPRSCPVPHNAVAYIGGVIDYKKGPTIVLWRNRKEIVIQAPKFTPEVEPGVDVDDPCYGWYESQAISKHYANYLEIIESLVDTIEFGKTNWAYLFQSREGGYYISQQKKVLRRVTCPIWAERIYLDEIEFTVWGTSSDRRGIWKGKEVDIMYAWNDEELWCLNRAMFGYKKVQGLDVTFEVYGHLIGRDGSIIGLVSEAAWGRMIGLDDRALVYQTVARIQQSGCIYKGCYTDRFMIANGKVRLLELNSIWAYEDMDRLEKDAELWHWKELDELFAEFRDIGPNGNYHYPLFRFTTTYADLKYFRPSPSPERPFGGFVFYSEFFDIYEPWSGYHRLPDGDDENESILPSSDRRIVWPPNNRLLPNFDSIYDADVARREDQATSMRLNGRSTRTSRNRVLIAATPYYHPYRRSNGRNHGGRRALTNSDNTESAIVAIE